MTKKVIAGFFGKYRWLSNFWESPIEYDGILCPTVEHAYQMAKCVNNEDRAAVAAATSPAEAKRLGNKFHKYSDWDRVKVDAMKDLLRRKFNIPYLRALLLETGDSYLEETNTWNDSFWGVCNGMGQNKLGELLMEIRQEIHAKV